MPVFVQKRRRAFVVALILLIAIAALSTLFFFVFPQTPPEATFREEYGLTLHDYGGNAVRMSAFRGSIMVAYAWASWCPYCAEEIENLGRLKGVYGDSIQVVAVNRGEPLSAAKGYTDQLSQTQGVVLLLDPEDSFFKSIGGYAMPETVFIDDRGNVVFHQRGPMKFDEVTQKVKELIES